MTLSCAFSGQAGIIPQGIVPQQVVPSLRAPVLMLVTRQHWKKRPQLLKLRLPGAKGPTQQGTRLQLSALLSLELKNSSCTITCSY